MSLSEQLSSVGDNAIKVIEELIEKIGVPSTYNGEKMLSVKMFSLNAGADTPYRHELLNDGYQVHYLTTDYAYDERGNSCNLYHLIENDIDTLCEILDALSSYGYPQYNVLLRAIVEADSVEVDQMDDENFEFPEAWEVSESSGEDERTIRLDTCVTVTASSRKEAAENAKDNPPSLGLEEYTCDVSYWVDMDQADNVELITD